MKNKILKLPLVLLASLLTIGCKGNDSKINSQEELLSALKFEGVKYVQVSWVNTNGAAPVKSVEEYSPTVYHQRISKGKTIEKYFSKEGKDVYVYDKGADDKWTKEKAQSPDEFIGVEDLYKSYNFDRLVDGGLTYDTLKYDNDQYTWEYRDDKDTLLAIENLKFNNKKLTYYQTMIDEDNAMKEDEHGDITYKEFTPELPPVEQ